LRHEYPPYNKVPKKILEILDLLKLYMNFKTLKTILKGLKKMLQKTDFKSQKGWRFLQKC